MITVKEKIKKKTRKVGKVTVTIKKKTSDVVSTPNITATPTSTSTAVVTATAEPTQQPTATATPTSKPTKKPTPTPYPENPEFAVPKEVARDVAVNAGTVEKLEYKTNDYWTANANEQKEEITRYALVVLPRGYDSSKKYPVCYVLHGFSDTPEFMVKEHKDTNIIWNSIANETCKEVICVYACTCCNKEGKSSFDLSQSPAYDYVINDVLNKLMPAINEHYPVLTERENTAICGFSMGGREAFNIGFRNPDKFGAIAGFCPAPGAFAGGDMLTEDQLELPAEYKEKTYIQLTQGAKDDVVGSTAADYAKLFTEKGIDNCFYVTMGVDGYGTPQGGHWRQVWQHGLYNFLKRAFPVQK